MSNDLPEARLSLKEASRLTSLSRATLYRAISSGALLARKLYNKRTVIAASDLAAFLKRSETPLLLQSVPPSKPSAPVPVPSIKARASRAPKRVSLRKAA